MSMLFLVLMILFLIGSILYEHFKFKKIKKDFENVPLFNKLEDFGFELEDLKKKNLDKWFSKTVDHFIYHCSFQIINNKITFELLLEFKNRLQNESYGFLYNLKFAKKYKKEKLYLSTFTMSKLYKIKVVNDLPEMEQVMKDFERMTQVMQLEKIKSVPKTFYNYK